MRQVADDNESKFDQEVTRTLRRNFYVDDNLKSVSTIPKAIWLVEQLTKLLAEGGFHLTKFTSNNRDVLASIIIIINNNNNNLLIYKALNTINILKRYHYISK